MLYSDLTNVNSARHACVTFVVVSPYKDALFAKRAEEYHAQVLSWARHRQVKVVCNFCRVFFLFYFFVDKLVYLCTFVYVLLFLAACPIRQCNMQFTYDIIIGLGPKSWFWGSVRQVLSIKATSTEVTRCSQFLDYPGLLL